MKIKMRYKNIKYSGFTLIEILVSITILSIILISVFSVYISSTQISLKTDITRALQQNVKSSVEKISEDIRKNGFDCVINNQSLDSCDLPGLNMTDS
jgi:prepilin-type N-terminal cleavage/methylation domain-containing protein